MGAVFGFLFGYFLGMKDGPEGIDELLDAWKTISKSEEVRGLLSGGMGAAKAIVRQGGAVVAGRLAESDGNFPRAA